MIPGSPRSLPRPAPFGKDGAKRVGAASQQTGELQRLIALRTRRQQTCALQRIVGKDFLITPVRCPLGFFHHSLR
jgi:hypothetical protein